NLGFENIWLRPMNIIGFAKEQWKEIGYSPEEFFDFYNKTLDYILNEKNGQITELMATLISLKILGNKDPEMTDMMSPCGAGISQLLYDHKGNIYTCDEGKIFEEFNLGNVKNSSWNDIFEHETLLSMIDVSSKKSLLCDRCEWEAFCGICPVNTYSSQGTIVSKLPMDFNCNLYGKVIENIFERLLFSINQREILENWTRNNNIFGDKN
ncbi:MAG: SPASM domain-containing protein, partial [Candidatus Aenigmatarchaeota archaeon]